MSIFKCRIQSRSLVSNGDKHCPHEETPPKALPAQERSLIGKPSYLSTSFEWRVKYFVQTVVSFRYMYITGSYLRSEASPWALVLHRRTAYYLSSLILTSCTQVNNVQMYMYMYACILHIHIRVHILYNHRLSFTLCHVLLFLIYFISNLEK